MHPINRLYEISQPIHSSNVIRLITRWLHKEDDLSAHTNKDRGGLWGQWWKLISSEKQFHMIRVPMFPPLNDNDLKRQNYLDW